MKHTLAATIVISLHILFYNDQAIAATVYLHPALANYNMPAKTGKPQRASRSVPVKTRTAPVK